VIRGRSQAFAEGISILVPNFCKREYPSAEQTIFASLLPNPQSQTYPLECISRFLLSRTKPYEDAQPRKVTDFNSFLVRTIVIS